MANSKSVHDLVLRLQDNLAAPMQRVARRVGDIVRRMASAIERSTRRARRAMAALGGRLRNIAGIGAAIGGAAAVAGLKAYADGMDRLAKQAGRVGVTAQALGGLRHAAALAGAEANDLDQGLKNLNISLAEESKADTFAALGIAIEDANGKLRTADEILPELADKMAQIEDPAVRAATAQKLMGEEGFKLMVLLRGGGDAIREATDEFDRLNGTITPEMAARAEGFADAQLRLETAMKGVGAVIADKVIPVIQPFIENLTEMIAANRELIGQKVSAFLQKVGEFLEKIDWKTASAAAGALGAAIASINWTEIINGAISVAGHLADMVTWLQENELLIPTIGTLLAANFAATVVGVVKGLAGALKLAASGMKLLNLAFLANPIGALLAAIAAVTGGLIYFFTQTETGRKIVSAAWDGIKAAISGAIDGIQAAWRGAVTGMRVAWQVIKALFRIGAAAIMKSVGEAIPDDWLKKWDGVKTFFSDMVQGIKDKFNELVTAIPKAIEDMMAPITKRFEDFKNLLGNLNPFGGGGEQAPEIVTSALGEITSSAQLAPLTRESLGSTAPLPAATQSDRGTAAPVVRNQNFNQNNNVMHLSIDGFLQTIYGDENGNFGQVQAGVARHDP